MRNWTEWSGINALLYYGPIIVRSVGLGLGSNNGKEDDAITLIVSGGIGIVQFLSVVPVIIVIDRLGEDLPSTTLSRSSEPILRKKAITTM
jgi:hypothetical protein